MNASSENLEVLGVGITPLASCSEAVERVGEFVAQRRKGWAAAINPEKIQAAAGSESVRSLLNSADLRLCDGIGAAVAVRLLHGRSIPRITGIGLFFELVKTAADRGWRVFLLGASEESNAAAFAKLQQGHPALKLVGRHNGYFDDAKAVIDQINAARPDILFVAMGSPKQEFWIAQHRNRIEAPFCMGVGGTLDVVSGRVERAPAVCRKTGTEWLYRLVTNPGRWRRQLVLPFFVWRVVRARLSGRSLMSRAA